MQYFLVLLIYILNNKKRAEDIVHTSFSFYIFAVPKF